MIRAPGGRKARLYEDVITQIREWIAQGRLAPGDRLPSERELAESLGVSRTAVREAMSALQAQGIVEVRHGSGMYVARLDQRALVEPLTLLLLTSKDELGHLLELRRGVEGEAAFLAARRAGSEDLASLTAAVQAMEMEVRAGGSGSRHDYDFHYAVAKASSNPLFVKMLVSIADIFRLGLKQVADEAPPNPVHSAAVLEQHRAIWRAIVEHDGDAARAAMRAHLGSVGGALMKPQAGGKGGEGGSASGRRAISG